MCFVFCECVCVLQFPLQIPKPLTGPKPSFPVDKNPSKKPQSWETFPGLALRVQEPKPQTLNPKPLNLEPLNPKFLNP